MIYLFLRHKSTHPFVTLHSSTNSFHYSIVPLDDILPHSIRRPLISSFFDSSLIVIRSMIGYSIAPLVASSHSHYSFVLPFHSTPHSTIQLFHSSPHRYSLSPTSRQAQQSSFVSTLRHFIPQHLRCTPCTCGGPTGPRHIRPRS